MIFYLFVKRLFDIICGLIGIILLIPLTIIIKIAYICHGDFHSIFYAQERIGKNGKKFKMYISPMTALNIDNHNRISTSDNRLLRRIVRDNRTRGYKVEDTLKMWNKVRLGEEKHIFPNQDLCDVVFNTSFVYELGVLKTYVEPLLYSVDINSPYYDEAIRLNNLSLTSFVKLIPGLDI